MSRTLHLPNKKKIPMLMSTMQVATTLPVELVARLDRRLGRTMTKRAEWFRNAILKQAEAEGIVKVSFDASGDVYELNLAEAVA